MHIFRRLQRPRELATLANNMGEVYLRVGRLHVAQRYFERAADSCATLGTAFIALAVEANSGATWLQLCEPLRALPILQRGLQRAQESGVASMASRFHAWLALGNQQAGRILAAEQEASAARLAIDSCEAEAQVDVLLALAERDILLGAMETVQAQAQRAAQTAVLKALPHAHAWGQRLQATALARLGDWDVAETLAHEASARCRELGFRGELARCYKLLGMLHWDLGLRSRASEEFESCFTLLDTLGLKVELGLSYLEVARLAPGGSAPEVR
jgi:tetratricopeptide (TPR) repeat protein